MNTPSIYQQAIFDWVRTGRGHAVVNAVAGSGKTTTIVEAAKLLASERVLFCAFNKHIQIELEKRLPRNVTVKTIHGIGYSAVAASLGKLRLDDDKIRALVEFPARQIRRTLEQLHEKAIRDGGHPEAPADFGDVCGWLRKLSHFARVSLTNHHDADALEGMADYYGIDVDPAVWSMVASAVREVIEESTRIARDDRRIAFDDMIFLAHALELRPSRYDWVIVDEAQDLSAAQRSLVLKCLAPGGRLLAVGDPRQSIQGFAGADPESFTRLKEALDAIELPLSVCYRCPPNVLELAREIVPQIEAAPGAVDGVIEEVSVEDVLRTAQEGDLILSRRTAPAVSLCIALIGRKIPARVKGKDIGAALARDVREISEQRGFKMKAFGDFAAMWAEKRASKVAAKKGASEAQIDAVWDRHAGIMACFEAFESKTAEDLARSIQELFADERRSVTLSTIHRAKGLEADRVFILESHRLPFHFKRMQPWEVFQEECLHYVALTRPRKELYLVVDQKQSEAKETP